MTDQSFESWAYEIREGLQARYGREIDTDHPEFRDLYAEGVTVPEFLAAVEHHVRRRLGQEILAEIAGQPGPLDEASP